MSTSLASFGVKDQFMTMAISMAQIHAPAGLIAIGKCVASKATARSWPRASGLQSRNCRSYNQNQTSPIPCSSNRSPAQFEQSLFRASPRIAHRKYSTSANTDNNTIQGTIRQGASGVEEEAQRVEKGLQAPDYLNEKEKMIFEKLHSELDPVRLDVCDTL